MAKIKMGALAQDARGSLAGTTFTKNRYGAVARQKVSPVQPRTQEQLQRRASFTFNSQGWRALTDAQRSQWNTYAQNHPISDVFGDSQVLGANAAYVQINATRGLLGLAAVAVPPIDPGTPPPAAISATADSATQEIELTLAAAAAVTDLYEVWTTRGVSTGVTFQNSNYRVAGAGAAIVGVTQTYVPTDRNPLLAFSVGQKVGVLVVRCSPQGVVMDSTRFDVIAT